MTEEPAYGCWCESIAWRKATQGVKSVGSGISELRIDYGPGYRVYCRQRGALLVLLLVGGDKSTQEQDIETARALAAQWSD